MIVTESPATDEARKSIRELDIEIVALFSRVPVNGIDYVGSPISRCYAKKAYQDHRTEESAPSALTREVITLKPGAPWAPCWPRLES